MSEKEMTAPVVSVGADTEQSSQNLIDNSLTDFDPNFKRFDAVQRKLLRVSLNAEETVTVFPALFFYPKAGGRRLKH